MLKILIIDPDLERARSLCLNLEFLEYEAQAIRPEALESIIGGSSGSEAELPDVVMLGPCSEENGVADLFRRLRASDPYLPLIRMAPEEDESTLPSDVESGSTARVSLPARFNDVQAALQQASIYRDSRSLAGRSRSLELFRNLVGGSAAIRTVRTLIEQVAGTDASVLLLGESGTGKEVVARHIHYQSTRRYKPFVPVNCGAIPGDLLESELFGHEKGAFTGAVSARRGRFEMANGGTLFLDEIGDMPLAMQVKLLRVLQERTFERVGSNRSVKADVRIIAATHTDLEQAIIRGDFREDLYYRLNVFPIDMPPLRERAEDLTLLVNDLISRIEHEKRGSIRLTQAALDSLRGYSWPGNVRELANLMERLVILYPYGVVDVHDLPPKYQVTSSLRDLEAESSLTLSPIVGGSQNLPRDGLNLKDHLARLERELIRQALDEANGVVAHAAKRLCMGRTTLVEKMKKLGIERPDEAA